MGVVKTCLTAGLIGPVIVFSALGASADPEVSQTQDPLAIVLSFNEAMANEDFQTAFQYVADDVVYENKPDAIPTVIGTDGIKQVLEPFFAPIQENEFITVNTAVNGNTVIVERLDRHLYELGWVELPVVGVYEITDGKISAWRDYFDPTTIPNALEALGGEASDQ